MPKWHSSVKNPSPVRQVFVMQCRTSVHLNLYDHGAESVLRSWQSFGYSTNSSFTEVGSLLPCSSAAIGPNTGPHGPSPRPPVLLYHHFILSSTQSSTWPHLFRMYGGNFLWDLSSCGILQWKIVVYHWRFGRSYLSHLQGWRSSFWTHSPLKMGPLRCPKISVRN